MYIQVLHLPIRQVCQRAILLWPCNCCLSWLTSALIVFPWTKARVPNSSISLFKIICLEHNYLELLGIFSLLWKTKAWLVLHMSTSFFVLPRGFSNESWFVPDSTDIACFALLLSTVKDAIRATQWALQYRVFSFLVTERLSWVHSDPKDFSIQVKGCVPL